MTGTGIVPEWIKNGPLQAKTKPKRVIRTDENGVVLFPDYLFLMFKGGPKTAPPKQPTPRCRGTKHKPVDKKELVLTLQNDPLKPGDTIAFWVSLEDFPDDVGEFIKKEVRTRFGDSIEEAIVMVRRTLIRRTAYVTVYVRPKNKQPITDKNPDESVA